MSIRHHRLFLCVVLSALFSVSSVAETTDPVGAISRTLAGGGKFSLLSKPFVNPVEFQGPVVSVGSNSVEVSDASGLTGTLYIEVQSGTMSGFMTQITGISGNILSTADDLSEFLAVDDIIAVRKLDTLASLFGSDNAYGLKPSSTGDPEADGADIVYIFNAEQGITDTYFYSTLAGYEGWYDTVTFTPAGVVPVFPDTGVMVRVNGPDVEMVLHGTVKEGDFVASVYSGFNVLAVMNPVSDIGTVKEITLANSGLFTGDEATGIMASPDGSIGNSDIVYIVDPETGFTDTYFYTTLAEYEGWYNTVTLNRADEVTLKSGSSFYLKRNAASGFNWYQTFSY